MNKNEFKNSNEYDDIFLKLLEMVGVSISWIQKQWKLTFEQAKMLYEEQHNYYDETYLKETYILLSKEAQPITIAMISSRLDVSYFLATRVLKFYNVNKRTKFVQEKLDEVIKERGFKDNNILLREGTYYGFIKFVREYLIELEVIHEKGPYLIRVTNESALDSWMLGMNKETEEMEGYAIASTYSDFFTEDRIPKINICIYKHNVQAAKEILLKRNNVYQLGASLFEVKINGNEKYKYQIQILDNLIINNLVDFMDYDIMHWREIRENDQETIDYLLNEEENNPSLPHLYGVVDGNPGDYYDFMKEIKPKNLDELAMIDCALWCNYKNTNKVKRCFKELGFDFTLYSKENAFSILTNMYDVDKFDAYQLIDSLGDGHELNEREEMMLQSHEVPDYVIEQFNNIKYLHHYSTSAQKVKFFYYLAYLKIHYPNRFNFYAARRDPNNDKFVGAFFYINNELLFEREMIINKSFDTRFVNGDKSHFSLFNKLKIEGEYSDYPRGRVIYDRKHWHFLIYIDKSLDKKEIIDEILKTYSIARKKAIILYDEHYTHGGL